jgi:hypothetical protein
LAAAGWLATRHNLLRIMENESMDIKQRLQQVRDIHCKTTGWPNEAVDLCRDALAEIEALEKQNKHLQEYAQHYPQCQLVKSRLAWATLFKQAENGLCDCGLIRTI